MCKNTSRLQEQTFVKHSDCKGLLLMAITAVHAQIKGIQAQSLETFADTQTAVIHSISPATNTP